jgi:phage tail-like protein
VFQLLSEGTRFFVFNRESDWRYGGINCGGVFENDVLIFEPLVGVGSVFVSFELDSGNLETVWHRLRMKYLTPENTEIIVRCLASDSTSFLLPGKNDEKEMISLSEYLKLHENPGVKVNAFESLGSKVFKNPEDVLLFCLKGRYLWFCIEVISYGEDKKIEISELKIEFPRISFIRYLPEVYQDTKDDSFFSRFIAIFQSIYVDVEEKIDYAPALFEPFKTDYNFLKWMSNWFNIKDTDLWSEESLRSLVAEAIEIFKIKGTRRSVFLVVKKYTGIEPMIIEQFDVVENENYESEKETFKSLYGENGFVFTVILKNSAISTAEEYANLLRIIKSMIQIDLICNLVVLQNNIILGNHCYIGINSYISKNNYSLEDELINENGNVISMIS